jgi:hypothetical protein
MRACQTGQDRSDWVGFVALGGSCFVISALILPEVVCGPFHMASSFYVQRKGEYVYDVTVTKGETVTLPQRYRARQLDRCIVRSLS